MTTVLTALTHRHEAEFVRVLEEAADVVLVRRCADLAELLSAGAAGVAVIAVVSADLRGLDRDALRHLAGHGVRVAGHVSAGDETGERTLRQLGVATVLGPGDDAEAVSRALGGLAGTTTSGRVSLWGADRDGIRTDDRHGDRPDAPWPTEAGGRNGTGRAGQGRGAPGRAWSDGEDLGKHDHLGDDDGPSGERVPARTTVVWGPTGAPGRTTVAVTLAARLAAGGVRTMVVDLDTWGASIAQALGMIDEAPGVAAAARASEQGHLDVVGLARLSPEVVPGLRVLTGLPKAERWPELRAAAVEDVLRLARQVVDHVVVDAGFAIEDDEELSYDTAAPRRNAATLAALEAADQLVVVGAADPVGLQRLVRAVQDVAVIPSPPPVVVVNKVRASAAGAHPERTIAQVLGRFAGMDKVRFVPWSPDVCDAALLAGRSVHEVAPHDPLSVAIGELAAALDPRVVPRRGGRRAGRRGRAGAAPARRGTQLS